jgi:hypothetical protein
MGAEAGMVQHAGREVRRGWGADENTDGAILAGVEVGAQQEDDDA